MAEDAHTGSDNTGLATGDRSQGYEVAGPGTLDGLSVAYAGKDTAERDTPVTLIWLNEDQDLASIFSSAQVFEQAGHDALIGARTVVGFGAGSAVIIGKEQGAPLVGTLLSTWLSRRGAMPLAEVAKLFIPVLQGVERLHAQGFAHGMISASHGLVDRDNDLRLLGPWLAHGALPAAHLQAVRAPELLGNQPATTTGDVYSLCALLASALMGEAVPATQERLTSKAQHDKDPLVAMNQALPQLDETIAGLLDRGLRLHPATRPQSVAELRAALEPFATAATVTSSSAGNGADMAVPPPLPQTKTSSIGSRIPSVPRSASKTSTIGQRPPPLQQTDPWNRGSSQSTAPPPTPGKTTGSGSAGASTPKKRRFSLPTIISFLVALAVAWFVASGGMPGSDDETVSAPQTQQVQQDTLNENTRPSNAPEQRKGNDTNSSQTPSTELETAEPDGVLEQFCSSRFMFEFNRDSGTNGLRDYIARCAPIDGQFINEARRLLGLN